MLNHHPHPHPSYHSTTTASPLPPAALHRKPIPSTAHIPSPRDSYSHFTATATSQRHSRTRTSSSSVFPPITTTTPQPPPLQTQFSTPQAQMQSQSQYPGSYQPYAPNMASSAVGTRRTLSNATSSTNSTASNPPTRSSSTALHRSSSTTSSSTVPPATSYVALMRKQKATVWCDRSQAEDPRILAAQRAAKARALMEVAGGPGHGAASTRAASSGSGVAAGVRKIRHGGAHKAMVYVSPDTGNLVTQTVPMRLSATEVDEGSSEDEARTGTMSGGYHHRTGSGRSSLGSGRRVAYGAQQAGIRHTPPHITTTGPQQHGTTLDDPTHLPTKSNTILSSGSRSSGSSSLERGFGEPAAIPQLPVPEPKDKNDDLVRRGSVDERTMTLGGARNRLFIANPDLSD